MNYSPEVNDAIKLVKKIKAHEDQLKIDKAKENKTIKANANTQTNYASKTINKDKLYSPHLLKDAVSNVFKKGSQTDLMIKNLRKNNG